MSTDSSAAVLLPCGLIYGSLYFAVVMASTLYGVTCIQTFFYFTHYQDDPLRIKILVVSLWALNTIHESLAVSGAYKYFMAGWVDVNSMLNANPELLVQILLSTLVAIPTQGFFIRRFYIFSGKNVIAPLIWVALALVQIVSVLIYVIRVLSSADGVQMVLYNAFNEYTSTTLGTLCLALAAAVDILIAVLLTFLLIRKRSATPFASTANTLQRLAVFAIHSGIWPALFALLTLILVNMFPLNLLYTLFGIPLCSVYCNTLLANLNARWYLRGAGGMHDVNVDLSKSSSPPVSDSVKPETDKQHGEGQVIPSGPQGTWKTTEVVTILADVNRSTTSESA